MVLYLVQLVLPSPSNLHNRPSLVHHHLVLLLKVERWWKSAHITYSSTWVLVVRHMCIFIVDRPIMSRGFVHCWVDLVQWDSLLVSLGCLYRVLVSQLCDLRLLTDLRHGVVLKFKELKDHKLRPIPVSLLWLSMMLKLTRTPWQVLWLFLVHLYEFFLILGQIGHLSIHPLHCMPIVSYHRWNTS